MRLMLVSMKIEISKDQHDLVLNNSYFLTKLAEEIADSVNYSVEGYGLIDPRVMMENDKYYITWKRFSSAD